MKEYNIGFSDSERWFRLRSAAIIIENGCVLFAGNDRDDYYYSVGGAIHHGETSEQAVLREVYEETGVKYEIDRLAFIHENFFKGEENDALFQKSCHELTFYYLMKPKGITEFESTGVCTGGVKEKMFWLPIDKLSEYKAFPTFLARELPVSGDKIHHIVTHE